MEKCRKLVIVRHGNTFRAGETPTRVGARTDLPLVEEERARSAGRYLREKGIVIVNPAKRNVMVVKNEMRLLKQKRNVLQI